MKLSKFGLDLCFGQILLALGSWRLALSFLFKSRESGAKSQEPREFGRNEDQDRKFEILCREFEIKISRKHAKNAKILSSSLFAPFAVIILFLMQ